MPEPIKRAKQTPKAHKRRSIFAPFRTIGEVSDGTPFAVGTLGQTFYIATVVGRSFQIYDAATLHLLFVSNKQTPQKISAITGHFHYVFCAYGNTIGVFKRGELQQEMQIEDSTEVTKIVVFGNYLVAASSVAVHIFEKKTPADKYPSEFYTTIPVNSASYGNVTDLAHMPTHVNKIVVATAKALLVYNVRTSKLLYTSEEDFGTITCVEPAPAVDIIAVGNDKGTMTIFNLRKGRVLQEVPTGFPADAITSISFRTDGAPHVMCSIQPGHLFFYDLNRKTRVHTLQNVHREQFGGCTAAQFLNGQPIVVSSGPDNTLKEWVFDPRLSSSDSSVVEPPRALRSRGGHSSPPKCILFADEEDHFIESASNDCSLWMFSLRKDAQSQEMSQRKPKKSTKRRPGQARTPYRGRFAPITMLAQENARMNEWDNVITCHQDEPFARTWSSRDKRVGDNELATIDGGVAKCVALTSCGNFGLVGSSKGGIGVYNIQSGKLRKLYRLHKQTVTGVAVDGMNRKMVSCGLDGIVGFYDFSASKYLGKLDLGSPITMLVYHRGSDLFAVSRDDMTIDVIDASTQKIVRRLYGHTNRITAMDFSPDGRWLVSASIDSTIRVWDLPTGGCIDGIKVASVVTSLKVSPRGDFLATGHVTGVGISLWTNRAMFSPVSTRNIEESEFVDYTGEMPSLSGSGAGVIDGAFEEGDEAEAGNTYVSKSQIESLVTLSHSSRSKYTTLLHLDAIKERSKPEEAVQKPENAPFFLDSAKKDDEETKKMETSTRMLSLSDTASFESEFTKSLREASESGNYGPFLAYLVDLSPSKTDLELRSLAGSEFGRFLDALSAGFAEHTNYELLTAILSMFLRLHGDRILNSGDEEVTSKLQSCVSISKEETSQMDELIKYSAAVMSLI